MDDFANGILHGKHLELRIRFPLSEQFQLTCPLKSLPVEDLDREPDLQRDWGDSFDVLRKRSSILRRLIAALLNTSNPSSPGNVNLRCRSATRSVQSLRHPKRNLQS
jgi:hypothetical protein